MECAGKAEPDNALGTTLVAHALTDGSHVRIPESGAGKDQATEPVIRRGRQTIARRTSYQGRRCESENPFTG